MSKTSEVATRVVDDVKNPKLLRRKVRLEVLHGADAGKAVVLGKVEGRNPAYSVKCRIGAGMVWDAEDRGILKPGMEIIEPHIVTGSENTLGTIVVGTVKGDLHDVGKNLVAMMFKGAGFEVVDLGIDVPKEKFLESIQQEFPKFLGISALLSTTLPNVVETIAYLRDAGVDGSFKILVGGAPVTEKFASDAKADGYAADAGSAIQLAKKMMNKIG